MELDTESLRNLVGQIADFAQQRINDGDISGPRYGALVKMVWCGTSGEPCHASCQSLAEAIEQLRELDSCSELDGFYISLTAKMLEHFPAREDTLDDFAALREMSAQIGKVIPLEDIVLPGEQGAATELAQDQDSEVSAEVKLDIQAEDESEAAEFILDEDSFLADLLSADPMAEELEADKAQVA
ncbi:MAG: hypothetical protein N4A65_03015 [Cohaesibacter sp.]|jgi:hypothetical protein|nr:hypothetical protein [Cohaesibacter sp.]